MVVRCERQRLVRCSSWWRNARQVLLSLAAAQRLAQSRRCTGRAERKLGQLRELRVCVRDVARSG